jgi:hypothetical protein
MVDEARYVELAGFPVYSSRDQQQLLRDYYGIRFCAVMHCHAIQATDAPIIHIFNNRIQAKQVPHNAGVGGSSPPVATIIEF